MDGAYILALIFDDVAWWHITHHQLLSSGTPFLLIALGPLLALGYRYTGPPSRYRWAALVLAILLWIPELAMTLGWDGMQVSLWMLIAFLGQRQLPGPNLRQWGAFGWWAAHGLVQWLAFPAGAGPSPVGAYVFLLATGAGGTLWFYAFRTRKPAPVPAGHIPG